MMYDSLPHSLNVGGRCSKILENLALESPRYGLGTERACQEGGSSLGRTLLYTGLRAMSAEVSLELLAAVRRASDHFRRGG